VRTLHKRKVSQLQIDPRIKEVIIRVLGPDEEVYVEMLKDRIRIIL